jgi:transmembrane sensor
MSPYEPGPPDDSPFHGEPVDRYLAGECTRDEAADLEHRFQVYYGRSGIPEKLRDVIMARALWERVAFRAGLPTNANPTRVLSSAPRLRRPTFARELTAARPTLWRLLLAASVIVSLLGAGAAWWAATAGPDTGAARIASRHVTTTADGQRAVITLPDSTRVVLAPASTLAYDASYGAGGRDVSLVGQAYFEVVHDAARPFRVHMAHGTATDLGTRFEARVYAEDSAATVVVGEGAVVLEAAGAVSGLGSGVEGASPTRPSVPPATESVVLRPGDLGRVGRDGHIATVHEVSAADYFAWTTGRLVFTDTPVPEALAALSRWYDLDLRLGDSTIATRHLTATFSGENANEMLQLLASTLGVRYARHGRVVTLSADHTRSH